MKSTKKLETKSKRQILKNKQKRPSWDEYFVDIMIAASRRATCDRGRASCVFVRDR